MPDENPPMARRISQAFFSFFLILTLTVTAAAQEVPSKAPEVPAEIETPAKVEVKATPDAAIADRLEGILEATGWFEQPDVTVKEGVVFLDGRARRREYREWAEDLAGKTEGVAAVVNRLRVERSPWDFTPALEELRDFWQEVLKSIPILGFGLLILAIFWGLALLTADVARRILARRQIKALLRDVAAKAIAIPVLILGLYIVLKISGLTRLALTVLGGTGIAGLVIGIAFRDILENFLASILISTRNPFRTGDLIEIDGRLGIVQKVTTRGTVLMDYDGNHIQIPNATVYKSTIINYTANPKRRMGFLVGIGYEDVISDAQTIALEVIAGHPAVLRDPEPLVLVENLGPATVNLRVYFWFDGTKYNGFKVQSSLIRLVKRAFLEKGISLPDEAREIVFPREVPVRLIREEGEVPQPPRRPERASEEPVATASEGGLGSEEESIREQARQTRTPEEGENLL